MTTKMIFMTTIGTFYLLLVHVQSFVSFIHLSAAHRNIIDSTRKSALLATVTELQGPFEPTSLKEFWCKKPLLIRHAFDPHPSWPSWEDIIELACADDCEARIIQHTPEQMDSFDLELGPFSRKHIGRLGSDDRKWSLLVNDVDRYVGELADWLDLNFGFIPRWRRDDAQFSIAKTGGGIGPHVDNYDVFLIQTSGERQWKVGTKKLTELEERTSLVPDIPVRILAQEYEYEVFTLKEGDLLYLPPRTVHWGTSTTGNCMTLSVGCRAPAAYELAARVAEKMTESTAEIIVKRYADPELILRGNASGQGPSIDTRAKQAMKKMVMDAVSEILEDTLDWDELIGRASTEAKRLSDFAVQPYSDIYDDLYLDAWGKTAEDAVRRVMEGHGALQRAEGIPLATSRCEDGGRVIDRLFALGEMWEVDDEQNAARIFHKIERGERMTAHDLGALHSKLTNIIIDLVDSGFLYAAD